MNNGYKSIPEVFIIESLPCDDINRNRCDGRILESQLKLMGASPIYRFAINLGDVRRCLEEFAASDYRFLHISCHGGKSKVMLAASPSGESYSEFCKYFNGLVGFTRITFSACELGNEKFYSEFYRNNKGVQSLIAPISPLPFQTGALYFATYYTKLMEECRNKKNHVKREFIERVVPGLSQIFCTSMRYAIYEPDKDRVKINSTRPGRPKYRFPWGRKNHGN